MLLVCTVTHIYTYAHVYINEYIQYVYAVYIPVYYIAFKLIITKFLNVYKGNKVAFTSMSTDHGRICNLVLSVPGDTSYNTQHIHQVL